MKTRQHNRWNIQYDAIDYDEAARMQPDVVAAEINGLRQRLAECQFLLAMHGDGMTMPDELRYEWPADDYREVGELENQAMTDYQTLQEVYGA